MSPITFVMSPDQITGIIGNLILTSDNDSYVNTSLYRIQLKHRIQRRKPKSPKRRKSIKSVDLPEDSPEPFPRSIDFYPPITHEKSRDISGRKRRCFWQGTNVCACEICEQQKPKEKA